MHFIRACRHAVVLGLGMGSLSLAAAAERATSPSGPSRVDFTRDVRSILADHCFACHGADEKQRQGKLRLDTDAAYRPGESGKPAIMPGKPETSELLRRVTLTGRGVMPPPATGKKLTTAQIAKLRLWIAQGATYPAHWAFVPPRRPTLPRVKATTWPRNAIDFFVLARLEKVGLTPSAVADRTTLIRRLSFDLLGLPPTAADVEAFVRDPSPKAYENLIDRLLASPHFGERMAIYWLDVVRYADSIGYHSDNPRNVAPYRDYVIRSFNDNKPFDQFTLEQMAGDLLADAKIREGASPTDPRLQWMRVGSAYNRLLQTTEEGGAQPKEYQAKYDADRVRNTSVAWLGVTMGCAECHDHKYDPFTTKDFYSFAAFFADVQEAPVGRREPGMLIATAEQEAQLKQLDERLAAARAQESAPAVVQAQQEWEREQSAKPDPQLPANVRAALSTAAERRTPPQRTLLTTHFRATTPLLAEVRSELAKLQPQRDALYNAIPKCLVSNSGAPREIRLKPRGNWQDDSGEVRPPAVPVAFKPFSPLPVGDPKDASQGAGVRATRLDFARWLVAEENPLTARVFVNRLWKLFFGAGLSRRLDDFGTQGSPPTHPELLDWLAVDFREHGWEVKRTIKLMVMSATYRQTSVVSPALRARDPQNELLGRQSSWRLEAELVRDNALAIAGLLVDSVGGRSVFPYQPPGYWAYLNFPTREWQNDQGEGLYRRSVYTHWQRTFLHPSLLAFDAPTREECCAERPRSNIPQQALVLLNDPQYVEAARAFATLILQQGGDIDESRIGSAYRRALARLPKPEEVRVLTEMLHRHLASYRADPEAAQRLLAIGTAPLPALPPVELAAWTNVARVILNLHETITRS